VWLSDIMSHAGLAFYAEVALVIFLIVFVAIVIRLFTSKRSDMERHGRMPLAENEPTSKEPRHDGR
jgi:cbb3-type cytochrome oxidase subunit 3